MWANALPQKSARGEAALAEREQQLAQRELLLTAKEKMTEAGLPVELLDALNVSSPEAMEKSLNTVKTVIDKIRAEAPSRVFKGAKAAESGRRPELGTDSQLRKAMGLS